MGVLLDRARRAFGVTPPETLPPEPFELLCACGERASGLRRDERQFIECRRCGQTLFVLPASPYPPPRAIERPAPRSRGEQPAVSDASERRRPFRVSVGLAWQGMKQRVKGALWSLVPPARWFSPVRLIIFGVIAAIAGTTAFTIHLSRRGALTGDIVAARQAWTAALEAGDFDSARRELERASMAIERYGSASHESREIAQLAREVAAFSHLLKMPIEDIIRSPQGPDYFRDTLNNPSLLVDAYVNRDGAGGYRIESGVYIGHEPARIDVSTLELFVRLAPETASRVLFSARVETVERSQAAPGWVIRLIPDSGVLITSTLCLEKTGWPVDETTREILERQAKWLQEQ